MVLTIERGRSARCQLCWKCTSAWTTPSPASTAVPGAALVTPAATPNAASLCFRALRRHWYPLESPRHIVLYTPRSAAKVLRATGFADVTTYQEVLTKDTARSLGYLLNEFGYVDVAGALGMMERPTLNGVLFFPSRMAALLGCADRFHAVAEA